MNSINYQRLLELKRLIDNNSATKSDKSEYMRLLYQNGNITKSQYDAYLSNENSDDIINAGLTIGGVLLAAWLIKKLLD